MGRRQYPIYNEVTACIYNSDKSWGAVNSCEVDVKVGSSKSNSNIFIKHRTTRSRQWSDKYDCYIYIFRFSVNEKVIAYQIYDEIKGKPANLLKEGNKINNLKDCKVLL